ncbi:Hypothetical predicted protein [Octopus vulgaris]|uniref:Uncharacterized protein n=1 Tax=Octopus vulgaris TaxID=6645 RepID=A0AA36B8S7_OCTVU|nr:Hypothetical predicted protein [Octopus vulgaris]
MRPAKIPKTHCAARDQKSLPTPVIDHTVNQRCEQVIETISSVLITLLSFKNTYDQGNCGRVVYFISKRNVSAVIQFIPQTNFIPHNMMHT